MKISSLTAAIFLSIGFLATAQEFNSVAPRVQTELDQALTELERVQSDITAEKLPLMQRLSELEEQVYAKRAELRTAERARDNQLVDLNALKDQVKDRETERDFLTSLLDEYVRQFEDGIHVTEVNAYREDIDNVKNAIENPDATLEAKYTAHAALLETSMGRFENVAGGAQFPGEALTPAGVLEAGTYTLFGPVAVFASSQSDAAGLAQLRLGAPEPSVIELDAASAKGIRDLATNGSGELPLDATMGNALKIASAKITLWEQLQQGGPVMIPMGLLALASVLIAIYKWAQISAVRIATPRDLQVIVDRVSAGELEEAKAHAKGIRGPVGDMLTEAVKHAREKKEFIEEALYEVMLSAKPKLESLLPVIALTAATAPLLGLLGTVTGMINTFKMISIFGTGDPKTLSSGISEALVTTKYGLVVAVPSLLIHAILSRKAKGVLGSMEQIAVGFINGIPGRKKIPTTSETDTEAS